MIVILSLALAAAAVQAAPAGGPAKSAVPPGMAGMQKPSASIPVGLMSPMQRCALACSQMMRGGQGTLGVQSGFVAGAATPPAITVANDGTIYVYRGGTLYKYSGDLKLQGSVDLPAPNPALGTPAAPVAPGAMAPGAPAAPG